MSFWGTKPSPFTTAEVTILQSIADHTFTDGQLIIGNSATGGISFATLVQGANMTITNGNGTITLASTGGGGSGITIGTTTITSGTNTRILYDNSGVVGEYTISGSGTVVAMATSPSFTTPALGVATATSLAIGGATIGSNGLAVTGHLLLEGVTSTGATGTGNLVFGTSPTLTTAVLGSSTATTQSQLDGSTKVSTTAYVDTAVANAIAAVNPAMAVQCATTAAGDTSSLTYIHVAGIGDTFTGSLNTAITIDGHTLVLSDRVLIKNDTQTSPGSVSAGVFNGIYLVTTIQTVGVAPVLTRALDYDTPSDINNTGAIPVILGTVNATTSWLLTSSISAVGTGTNVLTFTQFSRSPTAVLSPTLGGTGIANNSASTITITGSFGTTFTVSGTTSVTLPTSGTLVSSVTTGSGVSATNTAGALAFTLGAITPTTVNGNTFTTGTYTLTGTAAKTLNFTNTLTFSGTDSTTMTFPASSTTVAGLGTTQTFTGVNTFTPTARASGTAAYFTITIPADTGQTAATESIGFKTVTATRTWATSGTVALQRENYFAGVTYASANASQTFTDIATLYVDKPIAGTNAIFTRAHTLVIVDSTSAASAITGGFVIATTLGTSATSVGIGGGNINAGGTLTVGGHVTLEGVTSTGATGTALLVFATSPTLTTPVLGAATATSINSLTITTSTGTFTLTNSKTLSVTNTLTLSGTDSTTMTFPSTTASIARTDAAQTFTGTQTFAQIVTTNNAITATSNAATVPITSRISTVTNSSAATLTITITTTSAVDGQMVMVRILDFSAVAQTITWVNTENSTVTAPTTSNGSTTLPLTVGFQYNNATSKWRCIASA